MSDDPQSLSYRCSAWWSGLAQHITTGNLCSYVVIVWMSCYLATEMFGIQTQAILSWMVVFPLLMFLLIALVTLVYTVVARILR